MAEELLKFVVKYVLEHAKEEMEYLDKYSKEGLIEKLTKAIEHEKYLTEHFKCPIFITMWPKELKSFYMKQMDDGTVAAADLELPGIGETFGMSQRKEN